MIQKALNPKAPNPHIEALKDVGLYLAMAACCMAVGAIVCLLLQDMARACA